jgi:hypothetical protein
MPSDTVSTVWILSVATRNPFASRETRAVMLWLRRDAYERE